MAVRPEDVQHLKEAVAGMKRNGWTIEAVKALELRKYNWPGYPNREEERKEFLELWNAAFPE